MQWTMRSACHRALRALTISSALLGALAGCGGSGASDEPDAAGHGQPAAVSEAAPAGLADLKRRRLGVAVTPADASPALATAEAFFNYAEQLLPQYFPGPAATLKEGPWYYRSYFATGVMIGVNAGAVYVLGGPFGAVPARVGMVSDFMPANTAPVAQAGPAQHVVAGTRVMLDGSASSDANGDLLAYTWTLSARPAGSLALLSGASTVQPSFLADRPGQYVATLVVSDGQTSSYAATVTITASGVNSAPVANAGTAQQVGTGATVTLNGTASSDADLDPLFYSWTFTSRPAGSLAVLIDPNSSRPSFFADVSGNYVVALIVNDGKVNSAASRVTITAATANAAPVANAGAAQTVGTGSTVTLDGSASFDANGDALSYAWTLASRPAGSAASLRSATSARPSFVADQPGSYVAQLTVRDGKSNSAPATVTITATTSGASGLSALYGRMTLSYHFTGSTITYVESTSFSASDIVDGYLVDFTDSGEAMSCTATPTLNYAYLCVIVFGNNSTDIFQFNLSNGTLGGTYEYCPATSTVADCGADMVYSPDGTVSGTLVKTGQAPGLPQAGGQIGESAPATAVDTAGKAAIKATQPTLTGSRSSLTDLVGRQLDRLVKAAASRPAPAEREQR
ncbi:PKD domain-containing protein [Aquabacterium sp.]|uniref:PKD domain-containing protein n=1 Tax=Aquabacterium sp. TaxID=1872578 RepID=UPI002C15101F|nr:PKD domain-containing protein [Aquabacterium sp.]HSW08052.1 PKD domain-containing protein [Aquabacterium sp.]